MAEDGGMVMVSNAYKNDGRARAPSFEPERAAPRRKVARRRPRRLD